MQSEYRVVVRVQSVDPRKNPRKGNTSLVTTDNSGQLTALLAVLDMDSMSLSPLQTTQLKQFLVE